ncbi:MULTISPECIES: glycine betaine ABC transporter substrate-binding protein [Clostridia]|uniref:ABC transporter substrate-binding protein n=1 Tax=Clostridia TaxID=186801 RepID=UPI000EA17C69|nr:MULTISPECIES: glycine betaine ABC transporter substrate-binding protein [Clostridia]NBJ69931.1 glycine/betaine ABC transporter substrate-binding protein [Roseburia sp. 1XD42-34]RKI77505.1 glycine/betaine ABC transporter substrate-binding protein [Clostridium sp. 1xD42-85]
MKRLVIALILIGLVISGCSSDKKKITVGAKNFTEQFLLAKMTVLLLEDNGFVVDEKSNMGSAALRQALENKQVDVTWDYVATALVTYLDQEPINDKQEAFNKVKKIDKAENEIYWSNLAEANNTYTVVMRKKDAENLGIKTLSDLGKYMNESNSPFTIASDSEFANRPDGIPGLEKTYNFNFKDGSVKEMSYGLNYKALAKEEVDLANGHATDGRVEAFDLINLEDDKQFFPPYNIALAITEETKEKYPEIEEITKPLAEILTDETLRNLNYLVDIEEKSVDEVAKQFLIENGLLEE